MAQIVKCFISSFWEASEVSGPGKWDVYELHSHAGSSFFSLCSVIDGTLPDSTHPWKGERVGQEDCWEVRDAYVCPLYLGSLSKDEDLVKSPLLNKKEAWNDGLKRGEAGVCKMV